MAAVTTLACGPARVPPVRVASDPVRHETYVLAAAADGAYAYAELTARQEGASLAVFHMAPEGRERRLVATLSQPLETELVALWPDRHALVARIQAADLGAAILGLGLEWLPASAEPPALGALAVRIERDGIFLEDGAEETRLARWRGPSEELVWVGDPDFLAVEVVLPGTPRVRAAYPLNLRGARSQLLNQRAFAAHQAGRFAEALGLWTRAFALAPDSALLAYNLACVNARLARPKAALDSLEAALSLGGPRYREWALRDPDLASLRHELAFQALLSRDLGPKGLLHD